MWTFCPLEPNLLFLTKMLRSAAMSENFIKLRRALEDYIQYFETLSPRSIGRIDDLAEPSIRFKDPFHDVQGTDAFASVFKNMFNRMCRPRFRVQDVAWGRTNNDGEARTAYLRWIFTFELAGEKRRIEGVSEILLSQRGRVMAHIDHWDSSEQFYEHIPILGAFLRLVKQKLKA